MMITETNMMQPSICDRIKNLMETSEYIAKKFARKNPAYYYDIIAHANFILVRCVNEHPELDDTELLHYISRSIHTECLSFCRKSIPLVRLSKSTFEWVEVQQYVESESTIAATETVHNEWLADLFEGLEFAGYEEVIMSLLSAGYNNSEIAATLGCSGATITANIKRIRTRIQSIAPKVGAATKLTGTKVCRVCGKEKSLSDYYKNKNVFHTSCKMCHRAYVKSKKLEKLLETPTCSE